MSEESFLNHYKVLADTEMIRAVLLFKTNADALKFKGTYLNGNTDAIVFNGGVVITYRNKEMFSFVSKHLLIKLRKLVKEDKSFLAVNLEYNTGKEIISYLVCKRELYNEIVLTETDAIKYGCLSIYQTDFVDKKEYLKAITLLLESTIKVEEDLHKVNVDKLSQDNVVQVTLSGSKIHRVAKVIESFKKERIGKKLSINVNTEDYIINYKIIGEEEFE